MNKNNMSENDQDGAFGVKVGADSFFLRHVFLLLCSFLFYTFSLYF